MPRLLPLILAGLLLSAGCQQQAAPLPGRQDAFAPPQISFQSPRLQRSTAIDAPRVIRSAPGGNLQVTLPIRNTTNRPFTVDAFVTFFDEQGQPAGQFGPQTRQLPARSPTFLQFTSPPPAAADFQIDLREAR
jgi:hypothetical protein